VSAVKGVLAPLSAFSRAADRNIVDHVNLDMNEDQGMTTFIMRVRKQMRHSQKCATCMCSRTNYKISPGDPI